MAVKYLVAGPLSALISFLILVVAGVGILPAVGLSWLAGCAAIVALVVVQVLRSNEAEQPRADEAIQTSSTEEVVGN